MTITTNGAELKRFFADKSFWPDDEGKTWYDNDTFTVEGKTETEITDLSEVPRTARVTVDAGIVHLADGSDISLEAYFYNWRKRQTTVRLIVECTSTQIEKVIGAVESVGANVLR